MASTLGAFAYRRRLTIDTTSGGANLAGTLSSFPVCVAVTSTSWGAAGSEHLFDASNTNGKRVQFFDSAGTNLPYEVELYDSTGGTAIYWVNVPTITGNSTTTVDVGYGSDPNSSDQSQGTAVWDATYRGVWHLGDGTTLSGTDSTTNANTASNVGTATAAAGRIDGGASLNGSSQAMTPANAASLRPSKFSVSAWVKRGAAGARHAIFCSENIGTDSSQYQGLAFQFTAGNLLYCSIGWNGAGGYTEKTGSNAHTDTASLHHVAVTYDGANVRFYYDGAADGSSAHTTDPTYNATNYPDIGRIRQGAPTSYYWFNGVIDETRLSGAARSADWVKAEYFSAKTTNWIGDNWLTVGAEQTAARRIYAIRQAVTRAASW